MALGAFRRVVAVAAAGAVTMIMLVPGAAAARPRDRPTDRGELVLSSMIIKLDRDQVADRLADAGMDTARVRHGVTAYRVAYRTIDTAGRPTVASQLVAFPATDDHRWRTASYLHGTTVGRDQVASLSDGTDRSVVLQLAAAGYAVSAPDYLGLGLGGGRHPYGDGDSAASAALDGLRATGDLARQLGHALDRDVMITGFSQGGHSTMALGHLLQRGADPRFRVGSLAPVSGPFDIGGLIHDLLTEDLANRTPYLAYITISWGWQHRLYDNPSEVFLPPYDSMIEDLFDHTHPNQEVIPALPKTPEELFTPAYLERLGQPSGALARVIAEEAAVCDWRPRELVRLYTAAGDRDVPPDNATFCADAIDDHGGSAEVVDVGDTDHSGTILRAMPLVLQQFDQASR
jgi:hypothetical protein